MRVNVELDALLTMLAGIAEEAHEEAFGNFPGHHDKVRVGIAYLRDLIHSTLSVHQWMLPKESEGALKKAAEKFCTDHCTRSTEISPGEHEECAECPLLMHAVGAMDQLVSRVLEKEP